MADQKLTALTAITSLTTDDLMYAVDDPSGTPASKKITFDNVQGSLTKVGKMTVTQPASSSTLAVADGKTLTVSKTLTLDGTDGTTMTFPSTSATIARTDAANTFTGHQTIEGVTSTGATGTGKFVFDGSPTLVTPNIGVATATSVNKVAITAPATSATLTIADGKTATVNASLTLAGTDSTTITFQGTDTYVGRTTTDTLTNKTLTTPTISKPVMSATNPTAQTYTPSAAATATLDLSLSNTHFITMPAGNITIALSNDTNNQPFIISITQDGTGSRTVTWFTTIRWAGGAAPTLTTTASKRDVFGFIRTGSGTYDGFIIGQNI